MGPATVPEYSSGEIGAVDSETVEITFSIAVVAAGDDFSTGVTINVGSVSYTISSGTPQADKTKVRYVLAAGVDGTETVTWAYNGSGNIVGESGSAALASVSAQTLTNTAFEPHDLTGTSYWWHVRPSGSGYTAVDNGSGLTMEWTEDGGSAKFTTTTTDSEKPTLRTNQINTMSVLDFDGNDDVMTADPPDFQAMFGADSAAKTAWFVVKVAVMGSTDPWYSNKTVMTTQGGYWGVGFNDDSAFQGNYQQIEETTVVEISATTSTYVIETRHDASGSGLYISLNGGSDATPVASGATHESANEKYMIIGANWEEVAFFNGDIAEIVTSDAVESSANRTKMRNVLMNIYGLAIP